MSYGSAKGSCRLTRSGRSLEQRLLVLRNEGGMHVPCYKGGITAQPEQEIYVRLQTSHLNKTIAYLFLHYDDLVGIILDKNVPDTRKALRASLLAPRCGRGPKPLALRSSGRNALKLLEILGPLFLPGTVHIRIISCRYFASHFTDF